MTNLDRHNFDDEKTRYVAFLLHLFKHTPDFPLVVEWLTDQGLMGSRYAAHTLSLPR